MTPKQQRQLDSGAAADPRPQENQSVGVGLTLVRKLVQALDGEIKLESEVGKGTTIHIALPIRAA
jgi:two-component system, sensor histidine kinase ChiS